MAGLDQLHWSVVALLALLVVVTLWHWRLIAWCLALVALVLTDMLGVWARRALGRLRTRLGMAPSPNPAALHHPLALSKRRVTGQHAAQQSAPLR